MRNHTPIVSLRPESWRMAIVLSGVWLGACGPTHLDEPPEIERAVEQVDDPDADQDDGLSPMAHYVLAKGRYHQ